MTRDDLAAKVARLSPRRRLMLRMRVLHLRMNQASDETERARLHGQLTVLAEQLTRRESDARLTENTH